jgi:hypothetical protein
MGESGCCSGDIFGRFRCWRLDDCGWVSWLIKEETVDEPLISQAKTVMTTNVAAYFR